MLKKGDKFIHFTKYGGVNKGEVKYVGETNCIDTRNHVVYKKYHIITTNNVGLELDGSDGQIFKIEKNLTPEQSLKINLNFEEMTKRKSVLKEKHQKTLDERVKKMQS